MTYRVTLAVGAALLFHNLPAHAQRALIVRAADLAEAPWDGAQVLPPGHDPSFRSTAFGDGSGLMEFHVDEATEVVGIFDIVWLD
ncbi:MAG: hypothetical protein ACT4QG_04030 [Sporichthyaceae bacterium]